MDLDGLTALTQEIMGQGYTEETACRFAVLIGDTPIIDPGGRIVVRDGERELARLSLEFFGDRC